MVPVWGIGGVGKGWTFAIVPKCPPWSLTLQQWKELVPNSPQEADELRSEISYILRNPNHNHKTNLTIQEHRALTELKTRHIKGGPYCRQGVAMVIMDKQDYTNKAKALLPDTNIYKVLNKDPTSTLKNKLIQTLKDIQQSGGNQ